MRPITHLVLHCTATPQHTTIESIQHYWRNVKKWKSPGYHFLIKPDGEAVNLLPIEQVSNGVAGHNANSIHISYIGGVNKMGVAIDNRTQAQRETQINLLLELRKKFPKAKILGHRDFPGVKKACPSFDVASWLQNIGFTNT